MTKVRLSSPPGRYRLKALDLFCGAGGASVGLQRAGFDVTGVDINLQPSYPFRFIQADAMTVPLDGYNLIWASPPCQGYSKTRRIMEGKGIPNPRAHNLIPEVRQRLTYTDSWVLWVIENVPGAPLWNPFRLCGTMFGLRVIRHRIFESNFHVTTPPCGRHGNTNSHRGYSTGGEFITVGGHNFRRVEGAAAMGIDWMKTRAELSEAIPPAYSEFIGRQAVAAIAKMEVR